MLHYLNKFDYCHVVVIGNCSQLTTRLKEIMFVIFCWSKSSICHCNGGFEVRLLSDNTCCSLFFYSQFNLFFGKVISVCTVRF